MSTKNSMQTDSNPEKSKYFPALSLSTGLSLGFILGLLLDNLGMGLSAGLGLGGLVSAIQEHRRGEQGSQTAIAIWLLALVVVLGLWIWTR